MPSPNPRQFQNPSPHHKPKQGPQAHLKAPSGLRGARNQTPQPKRPSPNAPALWHPLDPVLAQLDQDKLTAFLLKQGFITEGQNYKWCGPNATSRSLKQLPSLLKAAGLDAVTA